MVTSPNKGYELQVTGTNTDQWGNILNADVFTIIDNNLGGRVSKSLTNVAVNLTPTESQAGRLTLNGVLTGNVLVTTQATGSTIVENNCTGAFTVTFQKLGVGSPIVIPNGTTNLVATGTANNPVIAGQDFPTGTRLLFQQTTPPAGWTKDTTTPNLNNSALRIVTGAVGGGGSQDFTTIFTTRGVTGTVGDTALTTAQIPLHGHPYYNSQDTPGTPTPTGGFIHSVNSSSVVGPFTGTPNAASGQQIGGAGGGQVHSHSFTGNNLDMNVRYFDVIVGVKI